MNKSPYIAVKRPDHDVSWLQLLVHRSVNLFDVLSLRRKADKSFQHLKCKHLLFFFYIEVGRASWYKTMME